MKPLPPPPPFCSLILNILGAAEWTTKQRIKKSNKNKKKIPAKWEELEDGVVEHQVAAGAAAQEEEGAKEVAKAFCLKLLISPTHS